MMSSPLTIPLGSAYFVNTSSGKRLPFYDGTWSCKYCGPRKAKRVRGLLGRVAQEVDLRYLYTLTLPSIWHHRPPRRSRAALTKFWHHFSMRAKQTARRRGEKFEYIKVDEVTEGYTEVANANVHVHFVSNVYFTNVELRSIWEDVVLGKRRRGPREYCGLVLRTGERCAMLPDHPGPRHSPVGVRSSKKNLVARDSPARADHYRAAAYVSKYISKGVGQSKMPWDSYRCLEDGRHRKTPWHRYTTSGGVSEMIQEIRKEPQPTGEWELVRDVEVESEGEYEGERVPVYNLQTVPAFHRRPGSPPLDRCEGHPIDSRQCCYAHGVRSSRHYPFEQRPPECFSVVSMEGSEEFRPWKERRVEAAFQHWLDDIAGPER